MIGYFYPALLCGAIYLVKDVSRHAIGLVAMVVIAIGLRQPRFVGDIERYVAIGNSASRYTQAEADKLATDIGNDVIEIDVTQPQPAIFLLVEVGRRKPHLTWSAAGWKTVFGYRDWAPVPPTGATQILTLLPHLTMRSHFSLSRLDPQSTPN